MAEVRVSVPATSANLGPGFDTFGLALDFFDDYTAKTVAGDGCSVEIIGEGQSSLPTDEGNLIVQSIAHVFKRLDTSMPGLQITARNNIPHGRGMGSSAAAIVGGVMLAQGLLADQQILDKKDLLRFATEIEGHPDNVAPAIYGGLTVSWTDSAGLPELKRLDVCPEIAPLILVPDFEVSTKYARSLQPAQVPYEDAVFNLSRAAMMLLALTDDPRLLFAASEDKLHQGYRGSAMPEASDLVQNLRAERLPAVVSGAGPSVLVLNESAAMRDAAVAVAAKLAPSWQPKTLGIDTKGARVEVGL